MATLLTETSIERRRRVSLRIPMPIAMLVICLLLGIANGFGSKELIATVNSGFGSGLGEYALILIPSFTLASALSTVAMHGTAQRMPVLFAPIAGAAMVCPDTAYAALGPMTKRHKLSVLFGAYAGFKLLVPAGPLIVATGLAAVDDRLALTAIPVFTAAWLTGLLYAHSIRGDNEELEPAGNARLPFDKLIPFALLAGLLVLGFWLRGGELHLPPAVDFLISPKGALLAAGVAALLSLAPETRAGTLESAMRRTAPLLLVIGAASALGLMLTETMPIARWAEVLVGTGLALPALFAFAASFKLAKGSSMATFAGTAGIVAPMLPVLDVSPAAAVLAMCAGAFVTIAPNDSLYWLVREDLQDETPNLGRHLAVGAALQGLAALAMVELLWLFAII